ncbi:uncharacterized protein L969DRAFT_97312 [Mixia osmundae IAM 14324]|uniref:NAD(P)-binding protein n=1 Tax=Mixia osmundae (strain CBS 9802 / IAM 14324 / JCM 22182 / KY 12970) TaxID=764103 RepID=G7EB42_MIXOS|nr:uncharacterized protein L969DRAFT_97312 [Mixia osmundae IAM 14324]KEI36579.1 hypothetical protein L969DRAFT_97312 [Mixia osmundae IAM 14324]GAB00053.1 hypothetical protein E5Q_06755 [Mixia osmundae IAM 14324]
MTFSLDDIPDQTGKVGVVSGGNAGIGYETVKALASKGMKVYMASRNQSKAEAAIKKLVDEVPAAKGRVEFLQLDLTSLKGSHASAEALAAKTDKLSLIVNNAGVMANPYSLTTDGLEIQTATNHFGPFVFTQTLLPLLEKTAQSTNEPVRIVNLSSVAHTMTAFGKPDFRSVKSANATFGPSILGAWRRYGQSKACQILYSIEFNKRYAEKKIYMLSAHPGLIDSGLWVNSPIMSAFLKRTVFLSPAEGALDSLYAATSPEVISKDLRGAYITPIAKVSTPSRNARDPELAKQLWSLSSQLLQEKSGHTS